MIALREPTNTNQILCHKLELRDPANKLTSAVSPAKKLAVVRSRVQLHKEPRAQGQCETI